MKFTQVLGCIPFFEKGFRERWNLAPYNDPYKPAIFFGICNNEKYISEHIGFKLIILASSVDGSKLLNHIKPEPNLVIKKELIAHGPNLIPIPNKFNVKQADFQIKDFSMFTPNSLGDKVYAYIGSDGRNSEFKYEKLKELSKKCSFEFLYGSYTTTAHAISLNTLKENYYNKCFVNINLSANTGMTSLFELAYMGRYTISNVPRERGPLPSVINFLDDNDIIDKINNESKKIGTTQKSIENCTVNDEWLDIDFWRD